MKAGVRRFFSVVGGSKMLVGVELLVVQLNGEEPNDSCDELHMQKTLDEVMTERPDLLMGQALLRSLVLGSYRGVDKKEFPGLSSEDAAAFPWSLSDTCTHRHEVNTQQHSAAHSTSCSASYRLTTVTGSCVGAEKVHRR